jgi:hypothetical protein
MSEEETPCIITIESSGEISENAAGVYNQYLIPSLLHETFYFVEREFTQGMFNENLVTLQLGFFEETSRELTGDYDFDDWDLEFPILINKLTSSPNDQFAICDEVKYSFEKNEFTLKLRTRN